MGVAEIPKEGEGVVEAPAGCEHMGVAQILSEGERAVEAPAGCEHMGVAEIPKEGERVVEVEKEVEVGVGGRDCPPREDYVRERAGQSYVAYTART